MVNLFTSDNRTLDCIEVLLYHDISGDCRETHLVHVVPGQPEPDAQGLGHQVGPLPRPGVTHHLVRQGLQREGKKTQKNPRLGEMYVEKNPKYFLICSRGKCLFSPYFLLPFLLIEKEEEDKSASNKMRKKGRKVLFPKPTGRP